MLRRFFLPLLLLLAILLLCVPWVIKQGLLSNLRAQGYEATLESVHLTPFGLGLRKLSVRRNAEDLTRIQTLSARWDLGAILGGRIAVRDVAIDGALLTLRERDDGRWEVRGVPTFTDKPSPSPAATSPSQAPAFGIERFDLRDSRLRLQRPRTNTVVQIVRAYLGPMSTWAVDSATPYDLALRGDFGHLTAAGELRAFATPHTVSGDVELHAADLQRILALLGPQPPAALAALRGEVGSQTRFEASVDATSWAAHGHTKLRLTHLDLRTTNGEQAALGDAGIDMQFEAAPTAQTIDGRIDAHQLVAGAADIQSKLDTLSWQGKAKLGAHGVHSTGQLQIDGLAVQLATAEHVRLQQGSWDGEVNRTASGRLQVAGTLTANGAQLDSGGQKAGVGLGRWQGQLDGDPHQQLSVSGKLALANMTLDATDTSVTAAGLHWDGDAAVDFTATHAPQVQIDGDVSLTAASAALADQRHAGFAQLDAQALQLRADAEGLKSVRNDLRVTGLSAAQAPQSLQIAQLDAPGLQFTPPLALRSGRIVVHDLLAKVVRAAPDTAAASAEATTNPESPQTPAGESPTIRIAGLELHNGQVQFRDEGTSPAFTAHLQKIAFDLGAFASDQPDTPSDLRLSATLGQFGQLELSGQLRPLQPTAFADMQASLLGFDMPELNPYLRANLGDEVESGQLDVTSTIQIERSELDVHNDIEVRKLALRKSVKPKAAKESGGSLLNSALNLLSDSDDTIRLKLPVTGAIDNPNFDLSDAINKALGKSIATGVLLYFQPLGALVAVGKLASGQFNTLEFNPVTFTPGRDQLGGDANLYLADLAKRLADRPNIIIKVCGVATEADRKALQPPPPPKPATKAEDDKQPPPPVATPIDDATLLGLAKARAATVSKHLNNALGIDSKRLIGCAPSLSPQADATPEVRLGQ